MNSIDLLNIFQGLATLAASEPEVIAMRLFLIALGMGLIYLGYKGILEGLLMIPMGLGMAVINAGVLLQGRLRVVLDDGRSREIRAGDALIEVVNRIHHGESLGPDPAVIVVVYAGAEGLPITIPAETAGPSR